MSAWAGELQRIGTQWRAAWRDRRDNALLGVWAASARGATSRRSWWRRSPGYAVAATVLAVCAMAGNLWLLWDMLQRPQVNQAVLTVYGLSGAVVLVVCLALFSLIWFGAALYQTLELTLSLLDAAPQRRERPGVVEELRLAPLTSAEVTLACLVDGLRRVLPPLLLLCLLASLYVGLSQAQSVATIWTGTDHPALPALLAALASTSVQILPLLAIGAGLATTGLLLAALTISPDRHASVPAAVGAAISVVWQPVAIVLYGLGRHGLPLTPLEIYLLICTARLLLVVPWLWQVVKLPLARVFACWMLPLLIGPYAGLVDGGLIIPLSMTAAKPLKDLQALLPYWECHTLFQLVFLLLMLQLAQRRVALALGGGA